MDIWRNRMKVPHIERGRFMKDKTDFQIYETSTGLKYALNEKVHENLDSIPNALRSFERCIEFAESTPRLYLFMSFLASSLLTTNIRYIGIACVSFYVVGCFLSCSFRYMSTVLFSKIGVLVHGFFVFLSCKYLTALSCVLLSILRLHNFKIALAYFVFCFLASLVFCTTIRTYKRTASLNGRYATLITTLYTMEMQK